MLDTCTLTNMVFAHSSQSEKQKLPVQTPMNKSQTVLLICLNQ